MNSNFSVIAPTMWYCSDFPHVIEELLKQSLVGQIIIIDNNFEFAPNIPTSPKILHLKQSENIYVNPAWNLGVRHALYDNLLFLNDDCQTDWNIFNKVLPYMSPKKGMIGTQINQEYGKESYLDIIDINPLTYGCLFFMHKKSYRFIPDELKIMWGDVFLFFSSRMPNYQLFNWPVWGHISKTSKRPVLHDIIHYDYFLWETKIKHIIF